MKLLTGHDGSCPNNERGVQQEADNVWRVDPMWRSAPGESEESPGRGYRFNVRIVNDASVSAPATVIADWGEGAIDTMHLRDIGFIKHEKDGDWSMAVPERSGTQCTYRLNAAPGETELGLWPAYNVAACDQFIRRISNHPFVNTCVVGQSEAGRDVSLFEINAAPGNGDRIHLMIQARDHPYETAGSFCLEGMIDYLLSDCRVARYFLQRFHVTVLPMTNPDGVHDGLSRLTAPRGADLNRSREQDDGAWRAIKTTLDRVQPHLYINLHNWSVKWYDGILCNSDVLLASIVERLPSQHRHCKGWMRESHADYLNASGNATTPLEYRSWKNYVAEQFNTQAVTLEFPWFGRDIAAMRTLGADAVRAVIGSYLQMIKG